MAMEQLPLSSSGIQSTSSEALQTVCPSLVRKRLAVASSQQVQGPRQNHSHSDDPPVPASRRIGSSSEGRK
ncbi:hypothetical protein MRX96_021584 [Rhipicephalus microplus]